MIFVTVGNATQGFPRLLAAIDTLADQGAFADSPIVIQAGSAPGYRSRHGRTVVRLPPEEFTEHILRATIIICHAGAGTLLHVLAANKRPIVMPRRPHYKELVDDHQVELVTMLAREGKVVPAWEDTDLAEAIKTIRVIGIDAPAHAASVRLVEQVRFAIEEVSRQERI